LALTTSESTKCSIKKCGYINAFAVHTNKGRFRLLNEDRVTIVYPIKKLEGVEGAFFGVYDGHGGSWCANYLRDNLHELIFNDPNFPKHIKAAIKNAFLKAEREILRNAIYEEETKRVGSCASVVLIVGKYMYLANLGDSRVIISGYFTR
jgi:protein phosphatase 2C family protein 2/3